MDDDTASGASRPSAPLAVADLLTARSQARSEAAGPALGPMFVSDDWPLVARFLSDHQYLAEPLTELPGEAHRAFPESSAIRLEGQRDPDDGTWQLVASILTSLGPAEALRRLDALDGAWWLAKAAMARDLCVTIGFEAGPEAGPA